MKGALRRSAWLVLWLGVFGVLVFAVFPTRTYLAQRDSTRGAEERLAVLQEETALLEARAAALDSDGEIERLAREDHGLVMPGEEAYVVLRPPLPPVDLPDLWLVGDPDGDPDASAEVDPEVTTIIDVDGPPIDPAAPAAPATPVAD